MKGKEAIQIIGVTRSALCQYVRQGRIRATRIAGGRLDYNDADVHQAFVMKGHWKSGLSSRIHPHTWDIIRLIGYDLSALRSSSTERKLADQRRIVAKVLTWLGMSRSSVGEVLNRNHSSVSIMLKTSYLVKDETRRIISQLTDLGYGKETTQEL